jgi:hypothetical protein
MILSINFPNCLQKRQTAPRHWPSAGNMQRLPSWGGAGGGAVPPQGAPGRLPRALPINVVWPMPKQSSSVAKTTFHVDQNNYQNNQGAKLSGI